VGTVVAVVAGILAVAGGALGSQPVTGPVSAFGGPVPVHIAHVGRIDVDLEPAAANGLRRVRCAGTSDGTTVCYVTGN